MINRPLEGLLKKVRGHKNVAPQGQSLSTCFLFLVLYCLSLAVPENGSAGITEAVRMLEQKFWHLFMICLRLLQCLQCAHELENRSEKGTKAN